MMARTESFGVQIRICKMPVYAAPSYCGVAKFTHTTRRLTRCRGPVGLLAAQLRAL